MKDRLVPALLAIRVATWSVNPNGVMNGYALHIRNADGGTALSFAIQNGDLAIVKALITGKVNVEELDEQSNKPLHTAVRKGNPGIVTAPHGIAVNEHGDIFVSELNTFGRVHRFNRQ